MFTENISLTNAGIMVRNFLAISGEEWFEAEFSGKLITFEGIQPIAGFDLNGSEGPDPLDLDDCLVCCNVETLDRGIDPVAHMESSCYELLDTDQDWYARDYMTQHTAFSVEFGYDHTEF